MQLSRAWIEAHIPHQGRMCLLDEIVLWDAQRIICRSGTHRALDNPLRAQQRLGIACGIEYAAQAMALHGALASSGGGGEGSSVRTEVGLLAGVRDLHMHVARLDDLEGDLICEATHVAGDSLTALYKFALRFGRRDLLTGRATVVLDAGGRFKI
jgi:predicted hotdog family 3-hydroxylacyl-ACP dehydratase